MLDIKFIRENPDKVKTAIKNRNLKLNIEELLALDKQWRKMNAAVEELRKQRNAASDEMSELVKKKTDISSRREDLKALSQKIKENTIEVEELWQKIGKILLEIPNIPHNSVPVGKDLGANKVVKTWGEPKKLGFLAKTHVELVEYLDIIDLPRAAKITGANFVLFKGKGALLERALISFMLGLHTKKHGYLEISPPLLVNRASMVGTGQLPKLEEDMYRLKEDDLFLIPTAEVPVTNIHRDEILNDADLPLYYTAYTPCFRREAGSYGKDTKGLSRVHQFDKVELVKFVRPENSYDELEALLNNAEQVLQLLELPYRVACLSTGDLSFAAAKCYDIEAWACGTEKWFEVSSCSNFEDFQARRANIRYRDPQTKKTGFVHTLNGSGVALARTVIAILENYQQKDGSILVPSALRPFMDGLEVIEPKQ
ncbi:MAG: serine--tRNA ligase [Candidatus Omnitrophica bacterium]|nr:serine--tRNA ligase [Candidatus Omnitrophota bacterium]MBU1925357.1 serine--tRNA ligase [Candidatus Omnitrophota bacterium]